MELDLSGIPEELKKYPNWVNWRIEERHGKPTKIPINPKTQGNAMSDNPSTWGAYELAVKLYLECENEHIRGIGFMLSNGYSGSDLDHCYNPDTGEVLPWAKEIIEELSSYAEITPSNEGLRVLVKGKLPEGRRVLKGLPSIDGTNRGEIALYDSVRFFTVTGNHFPGTPLTIEPRESELAAIHAKVFGNNGKPTEQKHQPSPCNLSDDEILNRARDAKNGTKFDALWGGDVSGYPSPSEADIALCLMLAFWTGNDATAIDRLFKQSGLYRQKWDQHGYNLRTIQKAISLNTEVYSPKQEYRQETYPQKENPETELKELSYLTLNLPSSLEISQMEIKVDWLVNNLIPQESITLLHSIGGVGKTYLMYKIAKSVANGEPFFGLDVMKMPVYYIDFENPLPEIADRMKKIGGSENMRIWHLGHNPSPIRFDADEWEIYKSFPPGLFIIDSLRSSHLLEENSSKDASLIMARHKEIRALGHTITLIHHENKIGGYRGSTAWFDLSDHILKFSRVQKIGSDIDAEEENFDLPIRLGLGGKSRFSSAMDLKPMYFKFEDHQLCRADDPNDEMLGKLADLLNPAYPPNQAEFQKLAKENLEMGKATFRKMLGMGEHRGLWFAQKSTVGHKLEYRRR
jgi:hypothetical protein